MSGYIARKGFLFQDLYLLLRVLKAASDSLDSAWRGGSSNVIDVLGTVQLRFGLEASASAVRDPAKPAVLEWDVLVFEKSKLEFAEVKSGAVTKDDRTAFWRRLRRELTRDFNAGTFLVPILVVDPTKLDTLDKWHELAQVAAVFSDSTPSQEPIGNVVTATQLVEEALWCMCCPESSVDGGNAPADPMAAIQALSRFELHCHKAQELESQVNQFVEMLFPGGLTETQQTLLLGWLGKRAAGNDEARRMFSIRELLQEVGVLEEAISLAPGTLKEWRVLWNEVPSGVRARTRLCLGKNGASLSAARVQPSALDVLTRGDDRSLVILGPGGAGKSTFIAQAAASAARQVHNVLHCGAGDLTAEELEQLAKAIRFTAALTALRTPNSELFLCIDGLDEADAPLRKRWAQLLIRIGSFPNVRTLVSIRDAVWRSDGAVRNELEPWKAVSLDLWSEALIRELLAPIPFQATLPPTLIDLLRTPILLDLFWRTFVEVELADLSRAARLQTRHSLLAAFWHERLLTAPRHTGISDIASRIMLVISHAAMSVGAFAEAHLDSTVVHTLLSEGILVREGRLQPHLRFRHPLLRDFALAQWSLEIDNPSEVSRRWNSIEGGLQRHGALRAMFEALSDQNASTDYPRLSLGAVVQEIVASEPSLASHVAHVLGTRDPIHAIDPATWSSSVQSSLPAEFARDLLSAARLDGNCAWAAFLERWPDDAPWFNRDYPREVWKYATFLSERAQAKPDDAELHEGARQAVRKLRSISEISRFANQFGESERWLKTQAMLCVIPALPDEATIAWVEREMAQASWRTRSFPLEKLIHLARVDAPRAAEIYRRAVGLTQRDGRPTISTTQWIGTMDHNAIEWSLAGEDRRSSLLKEFPTAFLPVALDLTEALFTQKHESSDKEKSDWSDLSKEIDPSWTKEAQQQRDHKRRLRLGELIDDAPGWRYWRSLPTNEPYDRCLKAVRECAEHWVKFPSNFTATIGILRSSRMASIHMMSFNILLENLEQPMALDLLRDIVLDSRLYYVPGFEYWIEQGLMAVWATLIERDRSELFVLFESLLQFEETEDDAKHYLARLPATDLTVELQRQRPSDDDASYRARTRPRRADFDLSGKWAPIESNELEIEIGQWPDDLDRELLKEFARSTSPLSKQETPIETLKKCVTAAVEQVKNLLPTLRTHTGLLDDASRFWVWHGLTQMFACFRRTREAETDQPDFSVALGCAELALTVLQDVPTELPGSLPEGDIWSGYRETGWGHALRLADEVLTWPPVADDERFQGRFIDVIKAGFATGHPLVQLVCTISIRPWHWFRTAERRELHDELVWIQQKHVSVLSWSLSRLESSADVDRARIFRLLLDRSDLAPANHLANSLGQLVGIGGMIVFANGQRSAAAEVARESINSPEAFSFLRDAPHRSEFLRGLIFGMKERAKLMSSIHPELAVDYGDWTLKVWRIMLAQRIKRNESEGIILFAMHWLNKSEGQAGRTHLRVWWQQLQPLFAAVIHEGGRPDCFTLLFQIHGGAYNDLTTPEELLTLAETFVERIRSGALAGTLDLDERVQEADDWNSWRDCAEHAAEAIDSLRNDGSLRTDLHREQAYRLLSSLAAEPIRCSHAVVGLHRLQNG